jgi:HEAT repeat protein
MKGFVFRSCGGAVALVLLTTHNAAYAQVPDVVTRQWIKETFLSRIDTEASATEQAKWLAVRDRPETVSVLIEIYEDKRELSIVRHNALLDLGATGQLRGYEYLVRRWNRMAPNDDERFDVVYALGCGPPEREHAPLALQKLREILQGGDKEMQIIAAKSLGGIVFLRGKSSEGARAILEARLKLERDSDVLWVIDEQLKRPPITKPPG